MRRVLVQDTGDFFGADVRIITLDLEDDPNERKTFDGGKKAALSSCRDATVAMEKRCAGDAKKDFDMVGAEIAKTLGAGGVKPPPLSRT